uniref:Putative secreted protein n=1 Tax=Anopheles triannulatus TaxID=58253 RepID=A0A2M4B729_9DIPT
MFLWRWIPGVDPFSLFVRLREGTRFPPYHTGFSAVAYNLGTRTLGFRNTFQSFSGVFSFYCETKSEN